MPAVASLSDYAPISPQARADFDRLERIIREASRVFAGNHTTVKARDGAIAGMVQAQRLCVEVRKGLRK